MFKIKMMGASIEKIEEILGIKSDYDQYQYIITNDVSFCEEDKVNIVFNEKNIDQIRSLVKNLSNMEECFITIKTIDGFKKVNIKMIEYMEVCHNNVTAIVGHDKYYIPEKLSVMEKKIHNQGFVRITKGSLVNLAKVVSVLPIYNYKLRLKLESGITVEVNRFYTKSFKEKTQFFDMIMEKEKMT